MPDTIDEQSEGTDLNKGYIQDRHQVDVAVWALMLRGKVGCEKLKSQILESLILAELAELTLKVYKLFLIVYYKLGSWESEKEIIRSSLGAVPQKSMLMNRLQRKEACISPAAPILGIHKGHSECHRL